MMLPREAVAVVGAIDPALRDDATVTSDSVDMSYWQQALFVLLVGATDITVDAKIQVSADNSSWSDLSGKAIGQVAATDDNKQWVLDLRAAVLGSSYRYARLSVTVGNGTTGAYTAAVALGVLPRQYPASDYDHADVDEIV